MTKYETGIVKWYDPEKGHGYIERDRGGELYVHYSALVCEEGDCILERGVKVKYTIIRGPRGDQAQDVFVQN